MLCKIDLTFLKPNFDIQHLFAKLNFYVENFGELTLIFEYMNNTYTYVVASCAKTCCSRKPFSTRFEHCIFTSCLGFHTAWKENMNTGCKKYNNLFCKYVYCCLILCFKVNWMFQRWMNFLGYFYMQIRISSDNKNMSKKKILILFRMKFTGN